MGFISLKTSHLTTQYLGYVGHQNHLQNLPGQQSTSRELNFQPPEAVALGWVKSPTYMEEVDKVCAVEH